MDELKKTKELVEKYLKKKYPDKKFSEPDLEFLARYSVKKEGCESEILKKLGHKGKVQDYYDEKKAVEQAKNCIQAIHDRFNTKRNSQKKKERIFFCLVVRKNTRKRNKAMLLLRTS